MPGRRRVLLWLLLLGALMHSGSARGADRTIPQLPPLDEDFAFQGEYAGAVARGDTTRWVGLQVVALGDGEFQAVEIAGGLPGNGGARDRPARFHGRRSGAALRLDGDGRFVSIAPAGATIYDSDRRIRGRLTKFTRQSRTLGGAPPPEARILFDGQGTREFQPGATDDGGLLNVGADTVSAFSDFSMHVEFRTPYLPRARGQGRGNSGVYIQGRYEVQILDSFGLDGGDNECGALYRSQAPLLNMCFPPMTWQTYDIRFTAARFDSAGIRVAPARITVSHNGIVIHKDRAIAGKTGAGSAEGPDPRPIRFQNHGDAVHFRNIWIDTSRRGGDCPCDDWWLSPARELRLCPRDADWNGWNRSESVSVRARW